MMPVTGKEETVSQETICSNRTCCHTETEVADLTYYNNNNNNNNKNNNLIQKRNSRFFTISSLRREPSPTRRLTWPGRVQSCANHQQHTERLSRAACRVTCHVARRDSSAIKFDRVEIAFYLSFILLAEPLKR